MVPAPRRPGREQHTAANYPRRQLPLELPGVHPGVLMRVLKEVGDEDVERFPVVHDGRHAQEAVSGRQPDCAALLPHRPVRYIHGWAHMSQKDGQLSQMHGATARAGTCLARSHNEDALVAKE